MGKGQRKVHAALFLSFIPPLPYNLLMKSHALYKSPRKALVMLVAVKLPAHPPREERGNAVSRFSGANSRRIS